MKVEKIRQRGELRKRVSLLEMDVIPRFKTFYEQAESRCNSCTSFHKDDYDLIERYLAELKTLTSNLSEEMKKPIAKQNIAHIEECLSLINSQEQMLEHFEKKFRGRIDCPKINDGANQGADLTR